MSTVVVVVVMVGHEAMVRVVRGRGNGEGRARECARAVGWWWKSEGA